ncbi:MAG: CopD family protein, partial [Thiohalomonadales bacterium]|nr:CopD family protein [Thiohalomonadales bacterium]
MSINLLTIVLHILSVVVWVGGMFFAYMCLRPVAASQLEPPVRLQLWVGVFNKFFPFVWIAVILLPLTGYLMISSLFNGMANAPLYVHLMNGIGSLMIFIYLHVFFAPYQRLKRAVAAQDWPAGGKALGQ